MSSVCNEMWIIFFVELGPILPLLAVCLLEVVAGMKHKSVIENQ